MRKGFLLVCMLLPLCVQATFAQEPRRPRGGRGAPPPAAVPEEKPAPEAKKPSAGPIEAFVGARLWTVSGPVIDGGTLLVQDGKILAVGTNIAIPEGAKIHDLKGKHLSPGFVALNSRGALGIRGISSAEKAADIVDPFSDSMLLCLSAGITTAHEASSTGGPLGGFFGGGGSTSTFSGSAQGLLGGVVAKLTFGTVEGFALREPAGVYFDLGQSSAARHEELRLALAKAAKARVERREWIDKLSRGEKDVPAPKIDEATKTILRVMEGDLPGFIHGSDRAEIERVVQVSEEFDIPFVMTGAEEAWTMVPAVGRARIRAMISPRGRGGMMATTRPYRDRFVATDHGWTIENAKHLASAGIPFAVMTMEPSYSLGGLAGRDLAAIAMDAAFTVRGGLREDLALRAITLSAAEVLGVADRVGSLDVGKDADFLVLDRDPLDYRALVDQAWVNGRCAYDRQEAGLWSHLKTDRSEEPGPWKPYGIWGPWPSREEVLQPKAEAEKPEDR